jgi:pyruvate/2-oxoglutarate dehydrogenase complex dihydrolipoamide dehydrogenase (E3) component
MSAPEHHDAIIIGSGQAGNPLAANFARAGYDTVLIEREHIGGTCVNEGCTPTKTMIASGRVAYLAGRGAEFGVDTGGIRIDMPRIRQRKRELVASRRDGNQANLQQIAHLQLIFGEARFTGPKALEIFKKDGTRSQMSADRIFINAGCRPAVASIDGLEKVPYLDSTSIMELDAVPEHLLVLGGGSVGLEFGQLFRRLGSRVTIIQSGAQLLHDEDTDIASAVLNILREDGIDVLLDTKATSVARSQTGIQLNVASAGSSLTMEGSHLLVATGRVPNFEALNLPAAGIEIDAHGFIKVNPKLETNVPDIYALGDIKGGPQFTHISYDDFRIIRTNLLKNGNASTEGRMVPYCVFIDPELGRIGITEAEASARKKEVRVAKMPMTGVARALEMDESRGFMKAIVDAKSGQILGAAVLGVEGGEIMTQIQIAMMGKLPYTVLRDATFAHPALGESLNNLFTKLDT